MYRATYAQRAAGVVAGPLAKIGVGPNHVTAVSLFLALWGAGLLALGEAWAIDLGAGLFVLARFLDSVDGRLAALTDRHTTFGYYFDYATGALSYAALFTGMGIGLAGGVLGGWAYALGGAGAAAAFLAAFLNLDLDRQSGMSDGGCIGYPDFAGFALEDGIFLIAPVAWLGWLTPFFALAGTGAVVYCLWTLTRLLAVRGANAATARPAGSERRPSAVNPDALRAGDAETGRT